MHRKIYDLSVKNNIEVYRKENELINNSKSTLSATVYNKNYESKGLANINRDYSDNNMNKALKNIYHENNQTKNLDTVVKFPFEKKLKK